MKYLPAIIIGSLAGLTIGILMGEIHNLRDEIKYGCAHDREKYEYCLKNHHTVEIKGASKIYTEKCN